MDDEVSLLLLLLLEFDMMYDCAVREGGGINYLGKNIGIANVISRTQTLCGYICTYNLSEGIHIHMCTYWFLPQSQSTLKTPPPISHPFSNLRVVKPPLNRQAPPPS